MGAGSIPAQPPDPGPGPGLQESVSQACVGTVALTPICTSLPTCTPQGPSVSIACLLPGSSWVQDTRAHTLVSSALCTPFRHSGWEVENQMSILEGAELTGGGQAPGKPGVWEQHLPRVPQTFQQAE